VKGSLVTKLVLCKNVTRVDVAPVMMDHDHHLCLLNQPSATLYVHILSYPTTTFGSFDTNYIIFKNIQNSKKKEFFKLQIFLKKNYRT